MTTYPRIVALNDECDSCSRCGRTGLKRVAWIATEPGEDPIPYGTTCALRVLRAAGKVSREARGWRAVELAYGQQQRADVRRVVGEYVKGIRVGFNEAALRKAERARHSSLICSRSHGLQ